MVQRILSVVALLACSVLSASAEEQYNWSGLYLGAHGGYGWGDTASRKNPYPGCTDCNPLDFDPEGGLVGGQMGYNFQFQNVVLGVEGDWSFMKLQGDQQDAFFDPRYETEISGLGSVRGRLGIGFGRLLPYLTAGYAWADAELSCTDAYNRGYGCGADYPSMSASRDQTLEGLVYGGDIEWAIASNRSLRGEYLRYDLDGQELNFARREEPAPLLRAAPSPAKLKSDLDVDVVRFGVNYKFDGYERSPVPLK